MDDADSLAQQLLETGLAFVKRPGDGRIGYLGRGRGNRYGPKVYSYAEAYDLELKPKPEVVDALRGMMLKKHEDFQREKSERERELSRAKFFKSKSWLSLRYQVLAERGARCECCGASAKDGAKMQVDHIKPRSKYPELALEKSNLQVLCRACNVGKSNRSEEDWRLDRPKRILRKT